MEQSFNKLAEILINSLKNGEHIKKQAVSQGL